MIKRIKEEGLNYIHFREVTSNKNGLHTSNLIHIELGKNNLFHLLLGYKGTLTWIFNLNILHINHQKKIFILIKVAAINFLVIYLWSSLLEANIYHSRTSCYPEGAV